MIRHLALPALAGLVALAGAVPAHAGANLIVNGNFSQVTSGGILDANAGAAGGTPSSNVKSGQVNTTDVYGWSTTAAGPLVLFTPGVADTTGTSNGTGGNGNVEMYGPGGGTGANNYSNNGYTVDTLPGGGGNYIVADADPQYNGALSQTVTGLTAGTNYLLTFDWAGGREVAGNVGANGYEDFQVTFGNMTFTTTTDSTASKGFTPWQQASFAFTAAGTSQVLSFLALGGPSGTPPMSLLDNVALAAVPEPTTWAITFFGGIGAILLLRRRKTAGTAAAV